tara:strand:+ start:557 stop:940 length:384 start_codon:yes stop_codon:yes gene_type:complete
MYLNCLNNSSGLVAETSRDTMKNFRIPIHLDHHDLYITEAQLQFYLNGISKSFKAKDILDGGQVSKEFLIYYEKCITYNLIWDLSDRHPKSSKMYWDDLHQEFRITYPKDGLVFRSLLSHGLSPSTL